MTQPSIAEVLLTAVAVEAYSGLPAFDNGAQPSFEGIGAGLNGHRLITGSTLDLVHDRIAARWDRPEFAAVEDAYDRFNAIAGQDEISVESIRDVAYSAKLLTSVSFESLSYLSAIAEDIATRVDAAISKEALSGPGDKTWEALGVELAVACDADLLSKAWSDASIYLQGDAFSDLTKVNYSAIRARALGVAKVDLSEEQLDYLLRRLNESDLNIDARLLTDMLVRPETRLSTFLDAAELSSYEEFARADARALALSRVAERMEAFFDHLPEDDALREDPFPTIAQLSRVLTALYVVYLNKIFTGTQYRDVVIFDYDDRFYYYNVLKSEELHAIDDSVVENFLRLQAAAGTHPKNQGWTLSNITADAPAVARSVGILQDKFARRDDAERTEATREIISRELKATLPDRALPPEAQRLRLECLGNPTDLSDRVLDLLVTSTGNEALMSYHQTAKARVSSTESMAEAVGQTTFDALVSTLVSKNCVAAK